MPIGIVPRCTQGQYKSPFMAVYCTGSISSKNSHLSIMSHGDQGKSIPILAGLKASCSVAGLLLCLKIQFLKPRTTLLSSQNIAVTRMLKKTVIDCAVVFPTYRQHFAVSEHGLRIIIIISPELTRQDLVG